MSLIRLLARPMLASAYIANGVSRVRHPEHSADTIAPVLGMFGDKLPAQVSPTVVARGAGVAQVAAGTLLAIGRLPRFSASVLVGTYLLDTLGEIRAGKQEQTTGNRVGLLTRTSLLGGALLASVDTAGKPGLAWRANHAAANLRKEVEKTSAKLANGKH